MNTEDQNPHRCTSSLSFPPPALKRGAPAQTQSKSTEKEAPIKSLITTYWTIWFFPWEALKQIIDLRLHPQPDGWKSWSELMKSAIAQTKAFTWSEMFALQLLGASIYQTNIYEHRIRCTFDAMCWKIYRFPSLNFLTCIYNVHTG